jgi:type IV pilus assembly protein PilC
MKQIDLTQEELASLCMALAHLIHAGIGTGDAIALLKEDEEDPDRRAILTEMANSADEGLPLAELFRRAACFPAYVCNLLEVGEQAGKTEETLTALARYYEGRVRMVQRLRAALLYPVVLLVVLLAVAVCLLVWVLPVFNEVYAQLGSSLTGVAGGLLAAGQILGRALPGLLAVLCLLAAAAAVAAHSPKLRRRLRTEGEKRWGDRGVLGRINTARFTQALSLALSSGMDANQAVTAWTGGSPWPGLCGQAVCCPARTAAF